jgi:hypothetical protein
MNKGAKSLLNQPGGAALLMEGHHSLHETITPSSKQLGCGVHLQNGHEDSDGIKAEG